MKPLSISLFALVCLTFLSGCASSESAGYYTPSQMAAQQAPYDPSGHTRGTRY